MSEIAVVERFLKVAAPARIPEGGLPEDGVLDILRAVAADESVREEHRIAAGTAAGLFSKKAAQAIGTLAMAVGSLPDVGPTVIVPGPSDGATVAVPRTATLPATDGAAPRAIVALVPSPCPDEPPSVPATPLADRVVAWATTAGGRPPADRRAQAVEMLEEMATTPADAPLSPGGKPIADDDRRTALMLLAALKAGEAGDADAEFVLGNADRIRSAMARAGL